MLYNIVDWMRVVLNKACPSNVQNFPFVLIGNKIDLPKYERAVSQQKALEWCANNGLKTKILSSNRI